MVYIVWLHYTLRILLLLFDRLKSLGLVIAELAFVCCHVFLLRVILTRPQQPPHHRLRAIVICVRTLSRLIAIMKPSNVARCAIVNEYLRRRKQPSCDAANRTRPEHQVELLSTAIEQTPDKQTTEAQAQPALNHVLSLVTSTANERCDTVAVGVRTIALDKISIAPSKSWLDADARSIIQKLTQNLDRTFPQFGRLEATVNERTHWQYLSGGFATQRRQRRGGHRSECCTEPMCWRIRLACTRHCHKAVARDDRPRVPDFHHLLLPCHGRIRPAISSSDAAP